MGTSYYVITFNTKIRRIYHIIICTFNDTDPNLNVLGSLYRPTDSEVKLEQIDNEEYIEMEDIELEDKISETCSKNLGSPLEAYESFMAPCLDLLFEHASIAMNNLRDQRESAAYYKGENFRKYEFKPLLREELFDYFLFRGANMAYKNKGLAQNNNKSGNEFEARYII